MKRLTMFMLFGLLALAPLVYWLVHTRFFFLVSGPQEIEDAVLDDVSAVTRRHAVLGKSAGWTLDRDGAKIDFDPKSSKVTRSRADGKVEWSTFLKCEEGHWANYPRFVADSKRIYFQQRTQGVAALDPANGKVLWHSQVPVESFSLSGDRLLVAYRWDVIALAADTGKPVMNLKLPFEIRGEILDAGGLLVARGSEGFDERSVLFDRTGKIHQQFSGDVVDFFVSGGNRILLTNKDVVCVTPEIRVVWLVDFSQLPHAGGRLIKLKSGDMVAFLYGQIYDSGVHLVRFNPEDGAKKWVKYCQALGASHSKYSHRAEVEVENDQLRVTSRGSQGTFVELLDLATGMRIERKTLERDP